MPSLLWIRAGSRRSLPELLVRRRRWGRVGFVLCGLGLAAIPAVDLLVPLEARLTPNLIILGVVLLSLVVLVAEAVGVVPIERRVKLASGEVCVKCGRNLKDCPDQGECPTCGAEYDKESLRAEWSRSVRFRRVSDGPGR